MFAITPDSVFKINSHAYIAIATSSIACGLGIACDVWFLLRYNWVDLETFTVRTFLTRRPHMLISLFTLASFSWCIWFIRLLFFIFPHSHLLHVVVHHLAGGLPWTCRVWCLAHRCLGDWGVSGPYDAPPVYRVCDGSNYCICIAHLDGWKEIDGSSRAGLRNLTSGWAWNPSINITTRWVSFRSLVIQPNSNWRSYHIPQAFDPFHRRPIYSTGLRLISASI